MNPIHVCFRTQISVDIFFNNELTNASLTDTGAYV